MLPFSSNEQGFVPDKEILAAEVPPTRAQEKPSVDSHKKGKLVIGRVKLPPTVSDRNWEHDGSTQKVILSVQGNPGGHDLDTGRYLQVMRLGRKNGKLQRTTSYPDTFLVIMRKGFLVAGRVTCPSTILIDDITALQCVKFERVWEQKDGHVSCHSSTVIYLTSSLPQDGGQDTVALELPSQFDLHFFGDEIPIPKAGDGPVYKGFKLPAANLPGLDYTYRGFEEVAIKTLPRTSAAHAVSQSILAEVSVLQGLRRAIEDSGETSLLRRFLGPIEVIITPDHEFLVSQHPRYGSLHDYSGRLVEERRWFTVVEARHVMQQVLLFLAFLHSLGKAAGNISVRTVVLQALAPDLRGRRPALLSEDDFLQLDVALSGVGSMVTHDALPEPADSTDSAATTCESKENSMRSPHLPILNTRTSGASPAARSRRRFQYVLKPRAPYGDRAYWPPELHPIFDPDIGNYTVLPKPYCAMSANCYELGVVLYFLLIGRLPFRKSPPEEEGYWYAAVRNGALKSHLLRQVDSERVSELEKSGALELLHGLLAFDSERRVTAEAALHLPWLQLKLPK